MFRFDNQLHVSALTGVTGGQNSFRPAPRSSLFSRPCTADRRFFPYRDNPDKDVERNSYWTVFPAHGKQDTLWNLYRCIPDIEPLTFYPPFVAPPLITIKMKERYFGCRTVSFSAAAAMFSFSSKDEKATAAAFPEDLSNPAADR
jgi:hypothetical protein